MLGLHTSLTYGLPYADRLGWRGWPIALKRTYSQREPSTITVPEIGRVTLRPGSDWVVFDQVFISETYRVLPDLHPAFIIDAGAHIGLSAAYFATKYPSATIYAIEPSPDNFELLKRNVARFPNVTCFQAAVWPTESESLSITNPDAAQFEYKVAEGAGGIRGVTIPSLLRQAGFERIDVLKLDIEGSELRLLSAADCPDWLFRCDVVMIELHDRMNPGCSMQLYQRLFGHSFNQRQAGDVVRIDLRLERERTHVRNRVRHL